MSSLTAVVEAVQLEQVAVAELHPLADDVAERWDLGDDGGLGAVAESVFAVVHHGAVVVGNTQRAGGGVIVGVEVVLFTFEMEEFMNLVRFKTAQITYKGRNHLLPNQIPGNVKRKKRMMKSNKKNGGIIQLLDG